MQTEESLNNKYWKDYRSKTKMAAITLDDVI